MKIKLDKILKVWYNSIYSGILFFCLTLYSLVVGKIKTNQPESSLYRKRGMTKIVLKIPYGKWYWGNKLGAYWDRMTNLWYLDSNKPLSKQVKTWIVQEQPRQRYSNE